MKELYSVDLRLGPVEGGANISRLMTQTSLGFSLSAKTDAHEALAVCFFLLGQLSPTYPFCSFSGYVRRSSRGLWHCQMAAWLSDDPAERKTVKSSHTLVLPCVELARQMLADKMADGWAIGLPF